MSNQKLDGLRKIIEDAPVGACEFGFIDNEIIYIDNSDNGHQCKLWLDGDWHFSELTDDSAYTRCRRSLPDIKTIIDQADKIKALTQDKDQVEISLEYRSRHLQQCEAALESRDAKITEQANRIAKLEEENAFFMDFAKAFYKHFGGDV